jgi:hypothetical protein
MRRWTHRGALFTVAVMAITSLVIVDGSAAMADTDSCRQAAATPVPQQGEPAETPPATALPPVGSQSLFLTRIGPGAPTTVHAASISPM